MNTIEHNNNYVVKETKMMITLDSVWNDCNQLLTPNTKG
jgi:hypothetical protein